MGKITCTHCKKSCKGQAIRLQEKYFHVKCFKCKECKKPLSTGGFYAKDEHYYCTEDYQKLFGTRCFGCKKFVEGEVVTALGNTYHQECFHCSKCNQKFGPGDKVTFTGKDYLCNRCVDLQPPSTATTPASPSKAIVTMHVPRTSGMVTSTPNRPTMIDGNLHSPMSDGTGTDKHHGIVYTETTNGLSSPSNISHYSNISGSPNGTTSPGRKVDSSSEMSFEVHNSNTEQTDGEMGYASGPILEKLHSNTKSDSSYVADSEPMSSPESVGMRNSVPDDVFTYNTSSNHQSFSHTGVRRQLDVEGKDHLSPIQHIMAYRSPSPGSIYSRSSKISRDSNNSGSHYRNRTMEFGEHVSQTSYLAKHDAGQDYFKKGPSINVHESGKKHFHRPANFSYNKVRSDFMVPKKKVSADGSRLMTALGNTSNMLNKEGKVEPYKPMKNSEAIKMAKLPNAQKEDSFRPPPIERDDWPAPPEPAAAYPELLRKHPAGKFGRRSRAQSDNEEENEENKEPVMDPKIQRDIEELQKIPDSGVGKILMKDFQKKRAKSPTLDPRSASRTPAADHEPHYKTRYESPIFASPSRDSEYRPRLQSMDDLLVSKYRNSTLPISNFPVGKRLYEVPKNLAPNFKVTKPGYGLKGKRRRPYAREGTTFMHDGGYVSDIGAAYFSDTAASTGYTSDAGDSVVIPVRHTREQNGSKDELERRSYYTSQSSVEEYDPETGLRKRGHRFRGSQLSSEGGFRPSAYLTLRRSIPSLFGGDVDPPIIYPFEQLKITNFSLPPGVERETVEYHLSKDEFEAIFHMSREEFYRLAEWKRNDMKKRVELF